MIEEDNRNCQAWNEFSQFSDKDLNDFQTILNNSSHPLPKEVVLKLIEELAESRKRIKDLERNFLEINNLFPRSDWTDFEHQISCHTDTLPIVHRELAQSCEKILDVVQSVMETFEPMKSFLKSFEKETKSS